MLVSLTWLLCSCSKGSLAPSIVTDPGCLTLLGAWRDLVGPATFVLTGLLLVGTLVLPSLPS